MRKTVSIDDDINELVRQEVRDSGHSFKKTINRLLRIGLMAVEQETDARPIEPIPRISE